MIRVKGLTYPDDPGGPVVAVYDDAGQYIAGINICTNYEGQIASTKTYFNFEGDLLTVTVNPNLTGYQYIGIGGYYTEPVIYTVTRNQEITELNYAVPNAANTTDTTIWANNYRFSSSGPAVETGTSISNMIPIKKGDTIIISGVTLRENADRIAVNVTEADGDNATCYGYFNNGVQTGGDTLISYKGYENGAYTFVVEDEFSGEIHYFRFAMPTPTDFSKVKVQITQ